MTVDADVIKGMVCSYINVSLVLYFYRKKCFCIFSNGIGSLLHKSCWCILRWDYDFNWCFGLFWCFGFEEEDLMIMRAIAQKMGTKSDWIREIIKRFL